MKRPYALTAALLSASLTPVARGLVAAADAVLPDVGQRLLQRLAVTNDPERETTLLAEMLAEDLARWPEQGWIVVDDYDNLALSVASQTFVETIVNRCSVNLLLAGPRRPAWVKARDLLAGLVLELPESVLAFTHDESAAVIGGGTQNVGPGVLAAAAHPRLGRLASAYRARGHDSQRGGSGS